MNYLEEAITEIWDNLYSETCDWEKTWKIMPVKYLHYQYSTRLKNMKPKYQKIFIEIYKKRMTPVHELMYSIKNEKNKL